MGVFLYNFLLHKIVPNYAVLLFIVGLVELAAWLQRMCFDGWRLV